MTCKSSEWQGLAVGMECLCRKQMLLRLPVITEHRSGRSVARQHAFQLKYITDFFMKSNMNIPSKFTILSAEQAKNKQTKIMASIDDEEHKCI